MSKRRMVWVSFAVLYALILPGCGRDYPVFHPVGPVSHIELGLIVLSTIVVAIITFLIWTLWLIVLFRFRDVPGNKAPYWPDWRHHRVLEVGFFVFAVVAVAILAIPTVKRTYTLAYVPARHPLVINVTALDFKWVFQYPHQHIATVNYFDMPVGRPVLFELTSHSPMATLWAPNLGGMEYAMPNRVLPLWLQTNRAGTFMGRNGNFDGVGYWQMTFMVHAVPQDRFSSWVRQVQKTKPPMTQADWHRLLRHKVTRTQTFSSYPANTFPNRTTEFTVKGLHYAPSHKP